MKIHLFILLVFFFCASCTETNSKSKDNFTNDKLKLIEENRDFFKKTCRNISLLKQSEQDSLIVYAFKAVKIDTTTFRKTHFHFKGWHVDYSNDHDVVDSLLKANYGIETIIIEEKDFIKLLGAEKLDSIIYQNRHGYFFEFKQFIYAIEEKFHYKPIDNDKVYWEEREVSFNRFKQVVKTKINLHPCKHYSDAKAKKECEEYWKNYYKTNYKETECFYCKDKDLNNITSINPMNNRCDELISQYCKLRNENYWFFSVDMVKSIIKRRIINNLDTTKLFPIKLTFDSLGNLSSVNSKTSKLDKRLFEAFKELNGAQQVKLLDKKLIGFSFSINSSDVKYWFKN